MSLATPDWLDEPDWLNRLADMSRQAAEAKFGRKWLWPWQIPGNSTFNVEDAYHLAYLNPAAARATGHDGLITYLFAAYVRTSTAESA